jgi:hypothetical protein
MHNIKHNERTRRAAKPQEQKTRLLEFIPKQKYLAKSIAKPH